jgi:DNA-binding MarR family transcriptional regulator
MQLIDGDSKTLKELSHDVGLANSTVSGIVDKLVEEGMLNRVQDESDRRRVLITVTEKALQCKKEIERRYMEHIEGALKIGSEEDVKAILYGLGKLNELMKESSKK